MQRVLQARRMLEETQLGIEAIAHRCGFGTAALLRHHFHRIVGVAPNDYRRMFSDQPVGRQTAQRSRPTPALAIRPAPDPPDVPVPA
jgi:AraC-like DNA-binding protein